ncbi:Strictosidine synthase [Nesidiocoris tenuis]|uniref:Strictosidine synthase n=1 Tax=Nesidiocoris tenuis TaxID=355587 RepID=A0ABN7AGU7_9HEMI|nr:Strictosidine synthase [Nesidiocoris tenuis]
MCFRFLSNLVKSSAAAVVAISIVVAAILYHPSLPPNFEYDAYSLEPLPLLGPLKLNQELNGAERLFEGEVKGPEHLVVHNNELYTSAHGGYIFKVTSKSLVPIVKVGQSCENFWQEHLCGRILGFEFASDSTLYFVDAYYGIKKYNLEKKTLDSIVDVDTEIEGKKPMLPNSISVAKDGRIFWTDSSTTHKLNDGLMTVFGSPNGRLIVYDPKSKKNTVLIDNLHFANGVLLSRDESFVLVVESMRSKIWRYYLKGKKAGRHEVFVEGLPGIPDNLNRYGEQIVVCLVAPHSPMSTLLPELPNVRKFLARTLTMAQWVVGEINNLYQTTLLERAYHMIGHFEMLHPIQKYVEEPRATCVFLDESSGKITGSVHATDGNVVGVSGMVVHNGYFYLASPFNEYLARRKVIAH